MEVVNEDLLYQECLKVVLTKKGSNPYHTTYGTEIMSQIGQKISSAAGMYISQEIASALSGVQEMQRKQGKYQRVSLREKLYQVRAIDVSPSSSDPSLFFVDMVVLNASNQPVSINIAFSVPGAVALAGSNGLSLGTRGVGL